MINHFPTPLLLVGAVALTFLVSARQYIALHDYGRLAVRYQELASIDGITGLYNRRHFMEAAETAVAHAQHLSQPTVALMIDVDNFKQINDTSGHQAGDRVLSAVCALRRACLSSRSLTCSPCTGAPPSSSSRSRFRTARVGMRYSRSRRAGLRTSPSG